MLLSLDIASTIGWARFSDEGELLSHGSFTIDVPNRRPYPLDLLDRAAAVLGHVQALCLPADLAQRPSVVVIEETNPGGRAGRYSQKLLEYAHCLVLEHLGHQVRLEYIDSREWRNAAGVALSKGDRAQNRKLSDIKRRLREQLGRDPEPKELSAAKKAAGIAGKTTIKHASVRWANEMFGLELTATQDDVSDALGIGFGWFKSRK